MLFIIEICLIIILLIGIFYILSLKKKVSLLCESNKEILIQMDLFIQNIEKAKKDFDAIENKITQFEKNIKKTNAENKEPIKGDQKDKAINLIMKNISAINDLNKKKTKEEVV